MFVAALAAGEGWHNYHHAFPWDYRAAELGSPLNLTCKFIDFFAKYGVIYDRREATSNMVRKKIQKYYKMVLLLFCTNIFQVKNRALRTGDFSHHTYGLPEAAPATKTIGDFWHHPLNPTYTSVEKPKIKMLPKYGYALVEEELSKRELDDEILSKENEIMQQRLDDDSSKTKGNMEADMNSNYLDTNNNSVSKRNKSSLNVGDGLMVESCPGLATIATNYKLD